MNTLLKALIARVTATTGSITRLKGRFTAAYAVAWCAVYGIAFFPELASAQTLHAAGSSIFTMIYGVVGVAGGIATAGAAINWKLGNFLGARDPKATFFHALIGTGIGFAVPTIILGIQTMTGNGASASSL